MYSYHPWMDLSASQENKANGWDEAEIGKFRLSDSHARGFLT